ncbi:PREDICTED: proto-oncogene Mas-like [Charadrius vociferus]|uniref:proto-oncogene Mas-like n=1 Tax=Charadrius vociferus TaxID=50402 RepID=UPI000521CD5C|nr:PREDICTED: proto-oncogene Mas-like [Charadrius vociferus]
MEETNTTNLYLYYIDSGYADLPPAKPNWCINYQLNMSITASVFIGICLCGLVGNMVVLWFLGCQMKKTPFTVYVLNLAIADFSLLLFLLVVLTLYIISSAYGFYQLQYDLSYYILMILFLFCYFASMCLLTAMSIERCVSVLFPICVIFMFIFGFPPTLAIFTDLIYINVFCLHIAYLPTSLNSSVNPFIYFLVGSYRQHRFHSSVKVALRQVFEEKATSEEGSHVPEDTTVETTVLAGNGAILWFLSFSIKRKPINASILTPAILRRN